MPRAAVKPASDQRAATEKRARTRRLVLREALACIAEEGVAGATAAEIARRCDVSWGVIQYHFGDRVGLFIGLLESGAESLARALPDLESSQLALEDRVRGLLDGTWSLMKRDDYRVMLEIQLQLGRDVQHRTRVRKHVRQMRSQLEESWRKALPECPSRNVDAALRLAMIGLRGLALECAVEGSRVSKDDEREILLRSVLGILGLDDG